MLRRPQNFYRYVVATDDGMAPCPQDGLVSLATCKPVIRRKARVGDFVAAFAPSPAPHGLLVFAGRVAEVVEWQDYSNRYSMKERRDSVYSCQTDGTFVCRMRGYHTDPQQRARDLSGPVLIFDPSATWYFGDLAQMVPEPLIRWSVGGHGARNGRNHRVDEVNAGEPDVFTWLKASFVPGLRGQPRGGQGRCAVKSSC